LISTSHDHMAIRIYLLLPTSDTPLTPTAQIFCTPFFLPEIDLCLVCSKRDNRAGRDAAEERASGFMYIYMRVKGSSCTHTQKQKQTQPQPQPQPQTDTNKMYIWEEAVGSRVCPRMYVCMYVHACMHVCMYTCRCMLVTDQGASPRPATHMAPVQNSCFSWQEEQEKESSDMSDSVSLPPTYSGDTTRSCTTGANVQIFGRRQMLCESATKVPFCTAHGAEDKHK
jgi:hypothetical protein